MPWWTPFHLQSERYPDYGPHVFWKRKFCGIFFQTELFRPAVYSALWWYKVQLVSLQLHAIKYSSMQHTTVVQYCSLQCST